MSLLLPAAILAGCVKGTNNSSNSTKSLTATIESYSSLGILKSLLIQTKLDATFNQGGPYTFFGATDNAYTQYGLTTAYLGGLSDSALTAMILYGAYSGNLLTTSLPTGPDAKLVTMGGDSIFVTNNTNGIYVNGIQLTQGDILASNGVLDILAGPLEPPTGNFTQKIAQADTSLSFTVAAIARASQGKTNVGSMLTTGGPYTFFLPDNDAWRAAGYTSASGISAMNADSVANIVLYHIVSGRLFTSDMLSGATPVGLNQEPFTISTPTITGNTISGKNNTTKGNLVYTNIMVRNGVLHIINILLKP